MKKIILLIILSLMTITISCKKDKPIPESIKFSIPEQLPIINVTINGKKAKLLLDTGASSSLIDSNLAEKYGFSVYNLIDMDVNGIGGSQKLYHTKGVEVYYLEQPMYVRFKSTDLRDIRLQLGIVGVVGTDYLQQHEMVIDYKNKVLRKSNMLD
jgi:hypothetical protein